MENNLIGTIISAFTALGTVFGAYIIYNQLKINQIVYQSTFENDIVKRFYKITNDITFKVMFLKKGELEFTKLLDEKINFFYQYFDLTNQELFLNEKKRINPDTWIEWKEGIVWIMKLDSFKYAWEKVNEKCADDTFNEFREFIKENGLSLK